MAPSNRPADTAAVTRRDSSPTGPPITACSESEPIYQDIGMIEVELKPVESHQSRLEVPGVSRSTSKETSVSRFRRKFPGWQTSATSSPRVSSPPHAPSNAKTCCPAGTRHSYTDQPLITIPSSELKATLRLVVLSLNGLDCSMSLATHRHCIKEVPISSSGTFAICPHGSRYPSKTTSSVTQEILSMIAATSSSSSSPPLTILLITWPVLSNGRWACLQGPQWRLVPVQMRRRCPMERPLYFRRQRLHSPCSRTKQYHRLHGALLQGLPMRHSQFGWRPGMLCLEARAVS